MSAQDKRDREIEAFLAGQATALDALYKKLPSPEPENKLDAAILAKARHAVSRPRMRPTKAPRWAIAIGSAAGVVLAAGLAWRAGTNTWNKPGEGALPQATSVPDVSIRADVIEVRPITAPAAGPAKPASEAAPASVPMLPSEHANEKKEEHAKSQAQLLPPSPATTIQRDHSGVTEYTLPTGAAGQRPQPAPAKAPAPIDNDANTAGAMAHTPQAFSEPMQRAVPSTVRTPSTVPADSKIREDEARRERQTEQNAGFVKDDNAKLKKSENTQTTHEINAATAAPSSRESAELDQGKAQEPARWIAQIRKLLRERRADEALSKLKQFRQQYPDYALPPDLRDLAQ